jgi:hypothetical protein
MLVGANKLQSIAHQFLPGQCKNKQANFITSESQAVI